MIMEQNIKEEDRSPPYEQCDVGLSIPYWDVGSRSCEARHIECKMEKGHLFNHRGGYADDIMGYKVSFEMTWWIP